MVEMNEAADILNNLSPRSLVLFDELGRGTSTYDGISIAWAIVEHIHEHPKAKARTLFATHYHELNEMEKSFKRIKNYNVSVKEIDNKVIFLRKLERGGSEHSFGIHVAKMAGMPKSIVKRANDILKQLETDNRQQGISSKPMVEVGETRGGMQLSFFQLDDPVLCQIRDEILNLDVNNLTPLEALNKLIETTPIEDLRYYLASQYLNAAAPYLDDNFYAASFDFYGRTMSGKQEPRPRWKRAMAIPNSALGEAVGEMYVEKFFPAEDKARMMTLVENLRTALGQHIDQLDWMSDSTKMRAREKLAAFRVKSATPTSGRTTRR